MSESRRITATKKSSLAGLSEGWGDECFAIVTPATYMDQVELDELDLPKLPQKKQVDVQFDVIRKHFVSGKIKVLNASGEYEMADMEVDDAFASIEIADKIYADIMGFDLDPKDLREVVAQQQEPQRSDQSTATPSSTTPSESAAPSPES